MKIKLLLTFLLFQIPFAQSEITDKAVITSIFDGCMSEQTSAVKTGAMLEYCACYANKISLGMDISEVYLLGMDLLAAGNDETKRAQIALANKKLNEYLKDCISRLMP